MNHVLSSRFLRSGWRESDPRSILGKDFCYHYNTPAYESFYAAGVSSSLVQPNCLAVLRRWQFAQRTSHLLISAITMGHGPILSEASDSIDFGRELSVVELEQQ